MPRGERVYDAIVVGGGPAGAVAAHDLAAAGWDVLVVDASRFPRPKTCGGGLTVRAAALLPFSVDEVVEDRTTAFRFSLAGRRPVLARASLPFVLQVRRQRLDALLLRQALARGATLLEGRRVRAVRDGDELATVELAADPKAGLPVLTLRARLVVGADGARGVCARALGRRRLVPAVESDVAVPGHPPGVLALDYGIPEAGYGCVFPKAWSASVGVIAFRAPRRPLRAELDRYAATLGLPGLAARCEGAALGCEGDVRPPAGRRLALVGDAAGLTDPLTGEGIHSAIRSGRLLAAAVAAQSPRRLDLTPYAEQLERALGPELRAAHRLAVAFYRAPAFFHSRVCRHPGFADAMVRLCLGQLGTPDVARRLAALTLGLRRGGRPLVELAPA